MEVGWGGEGGMVGKFSLLASHLSHLTRYHRPQKVILPEDAIRPELSSPARFRIHGGSKNLTDGGGEGRKKSSCLI